MCSEAGKTKFQIDLCQHLRSQNTSDNFIYLIGRKYVVNAIPTGDLGVTGTSYLYGEEHVTLDVLSDRIVRKRLLQSGVVFNIASEKMDEIIQVSSNYSVD